MQKAEVNVDDNQNNQVTPLTFNLPKTTIKGRKAKKKKRYKYKCQVLSIVFTSSNELGSSCSRDKDCKVANSHCVSGLCDCDHYYARYNSTACLASKLLGQDCVLDEQCSLRVANSMCKEQSCQCLAGFTKFRKHTCLEPAKPGSVCYSDEHCQMWSKTTYCNFIITNLFGKCECKDSANCDDDEMMQMMMKPNEENSMEETAEQPNKEGNAESEDTDEQTSENHDDSWVDENMVAPFSDPFSPQKQHLVDNSQAETEESKPVTEVYDEVEMQEENNVTESTENSIAEVDEETSTEAAPNEGVTEDEAETATEKVTETATEISAETTNKETQTMDHTTMTILNSSLNESKYRIETTGNEPQDHFWRDVKPVSLGFPCQIDSQCQREDSESRCIQGVCDCVVKSNRTSCGRENTGCPAETFQCRSSGACVSWFFVCDGRRDCADGSDEECSGPVCPRSSFQCGENGNCLSLSVVCDGIPHCQNGEDERNCLPEQRSANEGCPKDTFQCANGRCLPKYEFCNAIPKCGDGSDESSPLCRSHAFNRYLGLMRTRITDSYCPFQCANGRCRSSAIVCSGRDGCGDNSDEAHCSVCRCPKIPTSS
ncbi:hypothetical protein RUM44_008723 [Polyplax serrata]|uniref:EB domain-containing protein n=1 Tax=Polyplax serrata TaxID=468196 RepID=A0ABR1BD61_POLSC